MSCIPHVSMSFKSNMSLTCRMPFIFACPSQFTSLSYVTCLSFTWPNIPHVPRILCVLSFLLALHLSHVPDKSYVTHLDKSLAITCPSSADVSCPSQVAFPSYVTFPHMTHISTCQTSLIFQLSFIYDMHLILHMSVTFLYPSQVKSSSHVKSSPRVVRPITVICHRSLPYPCPSHVTCLSMPECPPYVTFPAHVTNPSLSHVTHTDRMGYAIHELSMFSSTIYCTCLHPC
jgi:hypothetical protein